MATGDTSLGEALAAIRARNDELKAFITVREDVAGVQGIPLAVKDLFDTAGLRTTYGSAIFRDHVPETSAEAVVRLERAGYAVVGKTNLHEFAYGITSENPHYGHVANPLDPTRTPGGSSGGSAAALAAGLCDVALGTDSAGSIRIPAACCGVVGFKPTFGLVPTDGVFPLAPSYDCAGPMARTVAGCAAAMQALVPDFGRVEPVDLVDVVAGMAWLELADPRVRARVEEAAAAFGSPTPIEVDLLPKDTYPGFMREAAEIHRGLFAADRELYGANVHTKLERCLAVTDEQYEAALVARERYRARALEALGDVELLVVPTLTFVAPPAGTPELELREAMIRLTYPFSALGWPALALPCGAAEAGLPASVSLVARPGADVLVLGAGLALEQALSPV